MRYITNELGDIAQVEEDGVRRPMDPSDWGWVRAGGRKARVEARWPIDTLRAMPGFTVEKHPRTPFVPGPKVRSARWDHFVDGAAPPAAVLSKGGSQEGTLAYWDRLSEAIAHVGQVLPAAPHRSPMLIHDFVGGRLFRVSYATPAPSPTGLGTVYVLEDGFAIKVGFTDGPVAKRIAGLQTGNPRTITVIAEIGGATADTEALLHRALGEWNVKGEWFARDAIVAHAAAAGGFKRFLESVLETPGWTVVVHPPYQ